MSSGLQGRTVLVPRAEDQAPDLSQRIRAAGGQPVEAPTIAIVPGDRAELVGHLQDLAEGGFRAVCLTSPNGVSAVASALEEAHLGPVALAGVIVAVVGPGTARRLREELGLEPDLMPVTSTTAALGDAFPPAGAATDDGRKAQPHTGTAAGAGSAAAWGRRPHRVLLPRADIASRELPDALAAKGYQPVVVAAYRTIVPDDFPSGVAERLAGGDVDLLAFTSSSTVRNFVDLVGDRAWSGLVVSIGPVTSATCAEHGIEVAVEADRHDLDGLVRALERAAAGAGR